MYDIVYTYVNGDDPTHIQSKHDAMNVFVPEPESSHNCRFHSSCEIVFSLFSVYLFGNHDELHKIYIVISDHSHQTISFDHPAWVKKHNDFQRFVQTHVEYVGHSQIIPMEVLPTFNSHVIELYLANIENLLEEFVYFNDDCFLGTPVSESFFFRNDEKESKVKANIFPSSSPMKLVQQRSQKMMSLSMFQSIMNKTFDLLQARFVSLRSSTSKWNKCHHQAKALIRSSCLAALQDPVFATAIQQLSTHKFRSRQDFAPIELFLGYMYFTGKGVTLDAKPYTFYIEWTQDQDTMQQKFDTLLQKTPAPTLICVNDIPFETKTTEAATKQKLPMTKKKTKMAPSTSVVDRSWKVQSLSYFAEHYFQKSLPTTFAEVEE